MGILLAKYGIDNNIPMLSKGGFQGVFEGTVFIDSSISRYSICLVYSSSLE